MAIPIEKGRQAELLEGIAEALRQMPKAAPQPKRSEVDVNQLGELLGSLLEYRRGGGSDER